VIVVAGKTALEVAHAATQALAELRQLLRTEDQQRDDEDDDDFQRADLRHLAEPSFT
jgi:hypothetical protein